MKISRRDLSLLIPALASRASAQEPADHVLPSHIYKNSEIPYKGDERKKGREIFHGATHTGFDLEMHESILAPGVQAHAPHKHEHEEIIIVFAGTVEATVEGKVDTAEAGSVIYFASNQMHSSRNVGSIPCRYYVIEMLGKPA